MEKVLNNINTHIKQKLESNWFTALKHSLYKPIEKESRTYNKSRASNYSVKLTQVFLDEPNPNLGSNPARDSIYNSKYNSALQQNIRRL